MVTMKDVGRRAGVSAMTVSNVLRGKDNVTAGTARRVLEAADELGYRITTTAISARSLRTSNTRRATTKGVIGVAVYEFDNAHPAQLAASISQCAAELGYQTLFQQTRTDEDSERAIIQSISNQFCDGLVFSPLRLSPEEIAQLTQHRPTVLIDDARPQTQLDAVLSPSEAGAADAIRYLWDSGRRNIAVLGTGPDVLTDPAERHGVGARRLSGCIEAFRGLGVGLDEGRIIHCEWRDAAAREAIHRLGTERLAGLDALFCMTDSIALGAIRGLADLGLNVPDDIAVMGFDGVATGAMAVPALTTVEADIEGMARIAVERVIARIGEGPQHGGRIVHTVGHRLAIRESA